jgi:hypothetical protein
MISGAILNKNYKQEKEGREEKRREGGKRRRERIMFMPTNKVCPI